MKKSFSVFMCVMAVSSASHAWGKFVAQDPAFTEPEYVSMRNSTGCPNVGNVTAEFRDTRGHVEAIAIAGLSHTSTEGEIERLNRLLSAYVGLRSVSVACDPGKRAYIVVEAFTRDTSKGILERLTIEWDGRGYQTFGGTYLSK